MAGYYFLPRRLARLIRPPGRFVWWMEYMLIAALVAIFRWLPIRLSMRFARAFFELLGPLSPRAEIVGKNLRVAFPDNDATRNKALVRGSFGHLGVAVAELSSLAQIWRERARRIEFVLKPGAVAPSPQRRSVFVTAHLGAWQLTPLIGPHYGLNMPVIYAPEDNPYVDRKLADMRRVFGGPLVARDGGIKVLMRALDKGQSIGLTVDTRMDEGEALPFFGEDAMTNTAPARLALRYGCDMVPVLAERLPGARYRVSIFPAIQPHRPSDDRRSQVRDMIDQLNGLFEDWISTAPDQWLCMKRRWPKEVYQRLEVS